MLSRRFQAVTLASAISLPAVVGCSSDETPSSESGGGSTATGGAMTGGAGGSSGGTGGAASGSGGTTAGTSTGGTGGTSGAATTGGTGGSAAGTAGAAGDSSASGAGPGGASGAAGTAGAGGSASGAGGAGGGAGANGGAGGKAGAGGKGGASGSTGSGGSGTFTVTTPAFVNMAGCGPMTMAAMCATFPRDNTSYGTNVSPAMTWTGAPTGTQSFAVVLQDLTNGFAHWVLWNIPASVTMLAADVPKGSAMPAMPAGSQQCSLGTGDGYYGPGACGNVYEFVVYALSIPTFSPTQATNQTMVRMQLQMLGAQILGTASMRARTLAPNCP